MREPASSDGAADQPERGAKRSMSRMAVALHAWLGINEAIPIGLDTNFGFTLAPTEAGSYRIYCSATRTTTAT